MTGMRDRMSRRFGAYGLLKNLSLFDPFVVLFFREAGLAFLAIGSLYAIREVFTNVFEIPTGVVADAFGRRRATIASFATGIVLYALGEALRSLAFRSSS